MWQSLYFAVNYNLDTFSNVLSSAQKLLVCRLLEKHVLWRLHVAFDILCVHLTDGVKHLLQKFSMSLHPEHSDALHRDTTLRLMTCMTNAALYWRSPAQLYTRAATPGHFPLHSCLRVQVMHCNAQANLLSVLQSTTCRILSRLMSHTYVIRKPHLTIPPAAPLQVALV